MSCGKPVNSSGNRRQQQRRHRKPQRNESDDKQSPPPTTTLYKTQTTAFLGRFGVYIKKFLFMYNNVWDLLVGGLVTMDFRGYVLYVIFEFGE